MGGAQTSLDGFEISCASENACEETTINVMKNGELKCSASHACGGASISKAITVINATTFCYGNTGVMGSCAHAKLKTMTMCGVDNDDQAATRACEVPGSIRILFVFIKMIAEILPSSEVRSAVEMAASRIKIQEVPKKVPIPKKMTQAKVSPLPVKVVRLRLLTSKLTIFLIPLQT